MALRDVLTSVFVGAREERAYHYNGLSIENPSVPLTEALTFGGGLTAAGVGVSPENADRMLAVYAAERVLAEGVGQLPLHLHRRLRPRGRERVFEQDDERARLLEDAPNPEQTSQQHWESVVGFCLRWGNSYDFIELNEATGRARALWPLPPNTVTPVRAAGNELAYEVRLPDGDKRLLLADEVLHVKAFGTGDTGISVIGRARQAIGIAIAAEEYAGRFYANDARPGGVIQLPGGVRVSDKEHRAAVKRWQDGHKGLERSHLVAILDNGAEWKDIGMPNSDAQFLETRQFQVREIARAFRVPPHMIADLEGTVTYASIEQQSLDFVTYSLMPWIVRIEQGLKRSLFSSRRDRAAGLFPKFNVNALVRGDVLTRYKAYEIGIRNRFLLPNDARELEDMELLEGGDDFPPVQGASPDTGGDSRPAEDTPAPAPPPGKKIGA